MARELLEQARTGDALTVRLNGAWRIENIAAIEAALAQLSQAGAQRVIVDARSLEELDLSGAWLLREHLQNLQGAGGRVEFAGEPPSQFAFLEEITSQELTETPALVERRSGWRNPLGWLGRVSVQQWHQGLDAVGYLGRIAIMSVRSLRPRHLRLASITRHIYETGIQAIPIVSLIAFLISVIIAYLGAQQFRPLGVEIYTVDLVAVGVLRELGVLLTSIIVAGRSGSAFAAEIGVMQLNDEVDALKSMGVDPWEVLVLPRLIGLLIALPLLTIVADAMGLAGGALLSSLLLDISLSQFIPRLQDALAPTTFWAGLIKAPVFAALIAMVGTYRGMQVRDSSRELGRLTTVAVVESIFLVIFADAVFAIVFQELDF
jgi:phospholipid/cholesterol/gamma-HCH transport system permease protein